MEYFATVKDLRELITDPDSKLDVIGDAAINLSSYMYMFDGDVRQGYGVDSVGRTFITVGPVSIVDKYYIENNRFFRLFQRYRNPDSVLVTTGNERTCDGPCGSSVTISEFKQIRELILHGTSFIQSEAYFTPARWQVDNHIPSHACPKCKQHGDIIDIHAKYCNKCRS